MAQTTPLRRRMLDDMTVRNLSPATQQSYVYAVAKFSRFFDRSSDQLPRRTRTPHPRQHSAGRRHLIGSSAPRSRRDCRWC